MENHDKPDAMIALEQRVAELEKQNLWLRERLAELEAKLNQK